MVDINTQLIAKLVDSIHVEQPNGLRMVICSRCNHVLKTDVEPGIWWFMCCPKCRHFPAEDPLA